MRRRSGRTMKRELDFFLVDGMHYGGDQNWGRHLIMRMGGCSTVTACELSVCLAQSDDTLRGLLPFDPASISKEDFLAFFEEVFQFIHPGVYGLTDVCKYAGKFREFALSRGIDLKLEVLPGSADREEAARFIRRNIDSGRPVAYLMLKHADPAFDEFEWHWFTVTGYEDTDAAMILTVATYGKKFTMPFDDAWATGHRWKGGIAAVSTAVPIAAPEDGAQH